MGAGGTECLLSLQGSSLQPGGQHFKPQHGHCVHSFLMPAPCQALFPIADFAQQGTKESPSP